MKRLILAITLTLVASAASAQGFLYSAKFVCGKTNNSVTASFTAAPGSYFTSVNVHNPMGVPANVQKRFSVGNLGEVVGPLSGFFPMPLPPARTAEIECRSIYAHLNIPLGNFIEGFVEIRSNVELDVVGIYSVANTAGATVALHMERVPKRP
jgi:hypothetical protein